MEADLRSGWESYKASARSAGLRPVSAVASIEKRFAYCFTEAASAAQVREAHAHVSIPLEDVIEIQELR